MPAISIILPVVLVVFISKKGEKKKMARIFYESFSLPPNERARLRSITSPGFAKAFYEVNK